MNAAIAVLIAAVVAWIVTVRLQPDKSPRHHIYYCYVPFCTVDETGQHCGAISLPCMYRTNTPVEV